MHQVNSAHATDAEMGESEVAQPSGSDRPPEVAAAHQPPDVLEPDQLHAPLLRIGPGGDFERTSLLAEPEPKRPRPELLPAGAALVGHVVCLLCGFAAGVLSALWLVAHLSS